ncbi:hypothetical protein [Rhodococcus sp. WAY2]|nr:hypothetical protein [Rhodococcus sp. WAY2]QHE72649.1 hypothetical protein GFS60_06293 [Rhodococcus sp. WAY2]
MDREVRQLAGLLTLEWADRDPPIDALIDLYEALVPVPPLTGKINGGNGS